MPDGPGRGRNDPELLSAAIDLLETSEVDGTEDTGDTRMLVRVLQAAPPEMVVEAMNERVGKDHRDWLRQRYGRRVAADAEGSSAAARASVSQAEAAPAADVRAVAEAVAATLPLPLGSLDRPKPAAGSARSDVREYELLEFLVSRRFPGELVAALDGNLSRLQQAIAERTGQVAEYCRLRYLSGFGTDRIMASMGLDAAAVREIRRRAEDELTRSVLDAMGSFEVASATARSDADAAESAGLRPQSARRVFGDVLTILGYDRGKDQGEQAALASLARAVTDDVAATARLRHGEMPEGTSQHDWLISIARLALQRRITENIRAGVVATLTELGGDGERSAGHVRLLAHAVDSAPVAVIDSVLDHHLGESRRRWLRRRFGLHSVSSDPNLDRASASALAEAVLATQAISLEPLPARATPDFAVLQLRVAERFPASVVKIYGDDLAGLRTALAAQTGRVAEYCTVRFLRNLTPAEVMASMGLDESEEKALGQRAEAELSRRHIPPQAARRATRPELAREAGVSHRAVDTVLKGLPVGLEIWWRVVVAAERIGFVLPDEVYAAPLPSESGPSRSELAVVAGVAQDIVDRVLRGDKVSTQMWWRVVEAADDIGFELPPTATDLAHAAEVELPVVILVLNKKAVDPQVHARVLEAAIRIGFDLGDDLARPPEIRRRVSVGIVEKHAGVPRGTVRRMAAGGAVADTARALVTAAMAELDIEFRHGGVVPRSGFAPEFDWRAMAGLAGLDVELLLHVLRGGPALAETRQAVTAAADLLELTLPPEIPRRIPRRVMAELALESGLSVAMVKRILDYGHGTPSTKQRLIDAARRREVRFPPELLRQEPPPAPTRIELGRGAGVSDNTVRRMLNYGEGSDKAKRAVITTAARIAFELPPGLALLLSGWPVDEIAAEAKVHTGVVRAVAVNEDVDPQVREAVFAAAERIGHQAQPVVRYGPVAYVDGISHDLLEKLFSGFRLDYESWHEVVDTADRLGVELPERVRWAPLRWPIADIARAAGVEEDIVRALRDQRRVESRLREQLLRTIRTQFPGFVDRVPPAPPDGVSRRDLARAAGVSEHALWQMFESDRYRFAYSSWANVLAAAERIGFELPPEFLLAEIMWPVREIAAAAGVGLETVRRVRIGRLTVDPALRERVLEAMRRVTPRLVDRRTLAPPLPDLPRLDELIREAQVPTEIVRRFLQGIAVDYRSRRKILAAADRIEYDIPADDLAGPILWPLEEIAQKAGVTVTTVKEVCDGQRVQRDSRAKVVEAIAVVVPEYRDRVPPEPAGPMIVNKSELAREANVETETVDNLLNGRTVELRAWRAVVAAAARLGYDITEQAAAADIKWPTGEIARAAGVSPETVVKVRKGDPTVKPELRARVIAAIAAIAPELASRVPDIDSGSADLGS